MKKTIFSFLLSSFCLIFFLNNAVAQTTKYCSTVLSSHVNGVSATFYISCETIGGKKRLTINYPGHALKRYSGDSGIESVSGEGTETIRFIYSGNPSSYNVIIDDAMSPTNINIYPTPDWNNVCDNVAPEIDDAHFIVDSRFDIQVTAHDDQTANVNKYKVVGDIVGSPATVTSIDNIISVTPTTLPSCEDSPITCNLTIYAIDDAGNESEGKAVNFEVPRGVYGTTNLAQGKTAHFGYEGNSLNQGAQSVDGNLATRGGTQNGGTIDKHYLLVDLGESKQIGKVRIYWEQATPEEYYIQLSDDNLTFQNILHLTTRPKYTTAAPTRDNPDHYEDYDLGGAEGRYVKITPTTLTNIAEWGMSIWELEVYEGGECPTDDTTPPCMVNAQVESVGQNTAVIQVSAEDKDDNGQSTTVKRFMVDGTTYTAVDGKITLSGLDPCTAYTKRIYARDNSANSSEKNTDSDCQYREVSFTTENKTGNLALDASITVGKGNNKDLINNGNTTGAWEATGNAADINDMWAQMDLGSIFLIDHFNMYFTNAIPKTFRFGFSKDGTDWEYISQTQPTGDNTLNTYNFAGEPARYIRIETTEFGAYGLGLYEWEVYGTGDCYVADNKKPEMISATEYSHSGNNVTLAVEAKDDITNPVTKFVIDGTTYKATDGKITLSGLSPCMIYNYKVYAKDDAGNISDNYETVKVQLPSDGSTNIALNKQTYAGFTQGTYYSKYVVDGILRDASHNDTRWASNLLTYAADDWIIIDLGGVYKLNKLRIYWERGTSNNFLFQTAYDATITQIVEPASVRADNTNVTKDTIMAGVFSTFDHYREKPVSSTNNCNNYETSGCTTLAYDDYTYSEPVYGRYLRVASDLQAQWHSSMWEIEVYGECAEVDGKPVMQWAELISNGAEEAELYLSAIDWETPTDRMNYVVEATYGESGYAQGTLTYNFSYDQYHNGNTGRVVVGGLLPDVPYTLRIWAKDEDGNRSDNYKELSFRTSNTNGCYYEGKDAYKKGDNIGGDIMSNKEFQNGYQITINTGADNFDITVVMNDYYDEMDHTILQFWPQHGTYTPPQGEVREYRMTDDSADGKHIYTATISKTTQRTNGSGDFIGAANWTGEGYFTVKFQFKAGGIVCTPPIAYDFTNGCHPIFAIYHHDDQPSSTAITEYAGGTINEKIVYLRRFAPGIWETLQLPFVVDSIRVYDTDDHQWYSMVAQTNSNPQDNASGTVTKGNFWIRQQVQDVSGDMFQPSWFDDKQKLPQKDIAYVMRVPTAGGYYEGKYLRFYGDKNQTIATDFTLGAAPSDDDQYRYYGNNTMMPQSLTKAYRLDEDLNAFFRIQESSTLYPFEGYVIAKESTMKVMHIISRWKGQSVTTSLQEIADEKAIFKNIAVYSLLGQKLMQRSNLALKDIQDACSTLPQGCYLLQCDEYIEKIIIKQTF